MNEFLLILGMALVTIIIRYPLLGFVSQIEMPAGLKRAFKFVPSAVLSAIIFPAVFYRNGLLNLHFSNAPLFAGLIATVVAWRSRNLLLTILAGMGSLLLWRSLFP